MREGAGEVALRCQNNRSAVPKRCSKRFRPADKEQAAWIKAQRAGTACTQAGHRDTLRAVGAKSSSRDGARHRSRDTTHRPLCLSSHPLHRWNKGPARSCGCCGTKGSFQFDVRIAFVHESNSTTKDCLCLRMLLVHIP